MNIERYYNEVVTGNKYDYKSASRHNNEMISAKVKAEDMPRIESLFVAQNHIGCCLQYGILLRHLLLQNGVESRNIVSYMRKGNITLNDAIEEYILRKNAKKSDLDYDWMHELYAVLTDENMADEYDAFKDTFYVSDLEEDCIIQSYDEIETLQRKLLLYEIADALKEGVFDENESKDLLRVYDVTEKEVETIFFDLYNGFGNKISLSEPQQKRRNVITDIARRWYFLTGEERNTVLQSEQITKDEQTTIEELSKNITKYKNALHVDTTLEIKGVGLDEQ